MIMFRLIAVSIVSLSAVIFADNLTQPLDDRIVGGKSAKIIDYPWQVSLARSGKHFCGGSIIARNKILTAAHCFYRQAQVDPNYLKLLQVRVGSGNRSNGGVLYSVKTVTVHDGYDPRMGDNDIAILILIKSLFFTKKILPILLPMQDEMVSANKTVVVSGWGKLNQSDNQIPEILYSATVYITDQDACARAYDDHPSSFQRRITKNMVCAGIWRIGGVDVCYGDSGGALAEIIGGTAIQHGIVSWGRACAIPTHPGVYVRVARYINWISSVS